MPLPSCGNDEITCLRFLDRQKILQVAVGGYDEAMGRGHGLTSKLTGARLFARPVERRVGRSRYAEDSQVLAARINLHEHTLINESVILQPFVRTRQSSRLG